MSLLIGFFRFLRHRIRLQERLLTLRARAKPKGLFGKNEGCRHYCFQSAVAESRHGGGHVLVFRADAFSDGAGDAFLLDGAG